MSDFFGNLIARSFSSEPSLRPRNPSWFEPTRAPLILNAPAEESPTLVRPFQPDEALAFESTRRSKDGTDSEALQQRLDSLEELWPNETKPKAPDHRVKDELSYRVAEGQSTPTAVSVASPRVSVQEAGIVSTNLATNNALHRSTESAKPLPKATREINVSTEAGAIRPRHNLARLQQDLAKNAAPSKASPIQVTIGRIEVRAVMPTPARRQASAPDAPRVSLAQILARNNGGPR